MAFQDHFSGRARSESTQIHRKQPLIVNTCAFQSEIHWRANSRMDLWRIPLLSVDLFFDSDNNFCVWRIIMSLFFHFRFTWVGASLL